MAHLANTSAAATAGMAHTQGPTRRMKEQIAAIMRVIPLRMNNSRHIRGSRIAPPQESVR